jgi:hypothetical protein
MANMTVEAERNMAALFSKRLKNMIKNLGRCPICRTDDILEVVVNGKTIANCPTCQEKDRNFDLNQKTERQRKRLIEAKYQQEHAAEVEREMEEQRKRINMENNFMAGVSKGKSHYDAGGRR